jgi:hypothetical protein
MTTLRTVFLVGICACGPADGNSPGDSGLGGDGGHVGDANLDGPVGGSGDPVDINKSGTRIKMKVLNTPDGAKVFQNNYDTQRNEDCTFTVASDGVMRCLPSGASVGYGGFFSDAACTMPAGFSYPGCAAPTYLSVTPATAQCPWSPATGPTIYLRGATITTYYQKSGTTCSVGSPLAGYTFYAVGAVVAATSFQSATTAVE